MTRNEWTFILIMATLGGLLATGLVVVNDHRRQQRPAVCATTKEI